MRSESIGSKILSILLKTSGGIVKDIILIADPKILAMPILDNGEPLVEIKQHPKIMISPTMFVPYQKAPSYAYVRQTVANLLMKAIAFLPEDIYFYLEEGHRSIPVQKIIFDNYYAELKNNHPDWSNKTLFVETTKYVAPPHDTPPHSTGGAIDIMLINKNGEFLDMGAELNETPDKNQNRNFTFSPDISEQAKTNRKILITALSSVGFVNYPTEWWHWSYGDRYWAYEKNQSCAHYASIEHK
jgi:D-alanyl-D-alanine dipeptidase